MSQTSADTTADDTAAGHSAAQTSGPDAALANSFGKACFVETREQGHIFELDAGPHAVVDRDEFGQDCPWEPGDEVELLVEQPQADGWTASVRKATKLRRWDQLIEAADQNEVVDGDIIAHNKGGLSVDIGLRAFCPKSQIDVHRVDDTSGFVGRRETFEIIEFDQDRCNVVLSRRNIVERQRQDQRQQTIDAIEDGKVFDGVVRNIKKYGAFVDIGGIDGLLHISNMSWGRVDHPTELVQTGDAIDVVVLDYDAEDERLSLGRKQLLDNPWDNVEQDFSAGDVVSGKVVSLADFGAFVELAPGLEGLVHITEFSWTERVRHPSDMLEVGEQIEVKLVSIDTDKNRLSLSLKQLETNPWVELTDQLAAGDVVTGPIRNITDFGLFVQAAPSIEGLVHISDVSWTEQIDDLDDHFEVGQDVEVKVLDIDVDNQRMGLGIKQLSRDPWQEAAEVAKPGNKIEVTITKLTDFGAFAEVVGGIEGLIHISELAAERVENVHSVVRPGQEVEALVVSFDAKKERIALSLKRDELNDTTAREYVDDDGATAKLGDILGDQLGLGDDAKQDAKQSETADEDDVAQNTAAAGAPDASDQADQPEQADDPAEHEQAAQADKAEDLHSADEDQLLAADDRDSAKQVDQPDDSDGSDDSDASEQPEQAQLELDGD